MKYIDVDKLLAELDTERKDWLIAQNEFKDDDPELAAFYKGKAKKCAELYYCINSLKQEQPSLPSSLDEAAKKYGHEEPILPEGYNDGDIPLYEKWTADAFIAGAKWMAEQMK